MSEEKRKEKRLHTPDLTSELSDGKSGFFVVVDDVSCNGVGMQNVPDAFDSTVKKCLAAINASSQNFKLTLQPCWTQLSTEGKYKNIGFRIEEPSETWIDFVGSLSREVPDGGKREDIRHTTGGLMALISDGTKTYYGVVDDISHSGLRLTQISQELDESAEKYSVVIQSPTGDVKVSMHPCWMRTSQRGMYRTIGFKVQGPPKGWQKLISEIEKEGSNISLFLLDEEETIE